MSHKSIKLVLAAALLLAVSRSLASVVGQQAGQTDLKQQVQQVQQVQQQPAIDELLKDTMLLLDALDQRVVSVKSRTPNAMMRDNLRALDDGESIVANDHQEPVQPGDFARLDESLIEEALESELADMKQPSGKQSALSAPSQHRKGSRQLAAASQAIESLDAAGLASDSTERHIKFTLDLMKSIFQSKTSLQAKTGQQQLESFVISPLSVQLVLMMMHLGARGQTRREISQCLHLLPADQLLLNSSSSAGKLAGQQQQQQQHGFSIAYEPEPPEAGQQANNANRRQSSGASKYNFVTNNNNNKQQQQLASRASVASSDSLMHETFGIALKNLLRDPSVSKSFTSANQIFLQRSVPLSGAYERSIKHHYGADVRLVEFQNQPELGNKKPPPPPATGRNLTTGPSEAKSSARSEPEAANVRQLINDWVEWNTKGKISNFLTSPVPSSTIMMAINALYFKADWQYKFDPSDTEPDAYFTRTSGQSARVPMMVNRLPLAYAHSPSLKASVIELPYKVQRLGLFLVLPDETAGIFHTMQALNSSSFANLISSMRKPAASGQHAQRESSQREPSGAELGGVNVRIPKFSLESSPRLSDILSRQLGLKSLFSAELADLSGMFGPQTQAAKASGAAPAANSKAANSTGSGASFQQQAALDELVHKAVLQVDEHGSVAAATSATIVERVGLFNSNYFEADHPFLLFLVDKQTGLVLFSGVYAGPDAQESAEPAAKQRQDGHQ